MADPYNADEDDDETLKARCKGRLDGSYVAKPHVLGEGTVRVEMIRPYGFPPVPSASSPTATQPRPMPTCSPR